MLSRIQTSKVLFHFHLIICDTPNQKTLKTEILETGMSTYFKSTVKEDDEETKIMLIDGK